MGSVILVYTQIKGVADRQVGCKEKRLSALYGGEVIQQKGIS